MVQGFLLRPSDTTAFVDKESAQSFTQGYMSGYFRDEVRYYYAPSYIVRSEYRLLQKHQKKDILDLFSDVLTELEIRNKVLASMDKNNSMQGLSLLRVGENTVHPLKLL